VPWVSMNISTVWAWLSTSLSSYLSGKTKLKPWVRTSNPYYSLLLVSSLTMKDLPLLYMPKMPTKVPIFYRITAFSGLKNMGSPSFRFIRSEKFMLKSYSLNYLGSLPDDGGFSLIASKFLYFSTVCLYSLVRFSKSL
jgi:hypothetical protein